MSGTGSWSITVFQVSGVGVQQRILRAMRQVDRSGVVALSAKAGNHSYLIVDSERPADELHAQRVVKVFDRHAVRTYSSRDTHHHPAVATGTVMDDVHSRTRRET
ncbi:MAG: hypothetical protein ACR2FE_05825 [Aeromicrobium sp.]